jgi:hypothetical protein
MREIRTSGLMSGRWKQSMADIVWHHRETRWKTEKTNLGLNHCATSRLYKNRSAEHLIVPDWPFAARAEIFQLLLGVPRPIFEVKRYQLSLNSRAIGLLERYQGIGIPWR